MKRKVCAALLAIAALVTNVAPVAAQHLALAPLGGSVPSNAASIDELRSDIRGLEAALSGSAITPEEREVSVAALRAHRVQLYTLLKKRVGFLRSYQATAFSAGEKAVLENEIKRRFGEMVALEQDMLKASSGSPAALRPSLPAAAAKPRRLAPQQTSVQDEIQGDIDDIVRKVRDASTPLDKKNEANLLGLAADAVTLALGSREVIAKIVDDVEDARVDKETGNGSDDSAGTTSLVTKGATPAILSFAVENGALTREISGTTINFRGNLVGIVEALRNKGFLQSYRDDSPGTRWLRKFSFGFSFDTDRGNQPGTFLADRQQLSSYTARYEFVNNRDPRDPRYAQNWQVLASDTFQPLLNDLGGVVQAEPSLTTWSVNAANAISSKTTEAAIREEIAAQLNKLPALDTLSPDSQTKVKRFADNYETFLKKRDTLRELISHGALMTFEFKGNRRPGMVDTSNLKFVAEGDLLQLFGFGDGTTELTYNGSLTFFNSQPGPGMRRIRDFDNSLQLDVPFVIPDLGSFVLSFAGKYKRIMEDEMMNGTTTNGTMLATKGDMAVGQFKLTVPIKGVRVPLSLSFANRTEFIKERQVRGNIGFTLDFASFFSKFRP